ncbi:MAG: TM2 domain-containing protein [Lentisphaerae bacterium]|jgi:TM2 domain-containing membrane protein YozV|nr:TM2 domain-containing protein [Lentisphaerota bacterium]
MTTSTDNTPAVTPAPSPPPVTGKGKDKVVAGILGILLGALGIHKFYLGYTKEGVIMLLVSLVGGIFTCGLTASVAGVIGLVEGILYLTKSDEEFDATYVQNQKGWF